MFSARRHAFLAEQNVKNSKSESFGAGQVVDSKGFGEFPGDFGGAVWPPRS